tara:strand:- start:49 stop:204 length:156 start_codon:yes stop_codon:yes gene_type:complete
MEAFIHNLDNQLKTTYVSKNIINYLKIALKNLAIRDFLVRVIGIASFFQPK